MSVTTTLLLRRSAGESDNGKTMRASRPGGRSRAGKHRRRADKSDENNLPAVFGAKKLVEIDKGKPCVSDGRRMLVERLSASTEMMDGKAERHTFGITGMQCHGRCCRPLDRVRSGNFRAHLIVRK